ncbi:MAG: type II toxin-antitoxin system HicB family antitoxin [Pseudomonadota bacterium]
MARRFYPAVLERDPSGVFGVWFPDLPGCVAAARSQEEAMEKAQDALARGIQDLAERDRVFPEPTAFDAIQIPPGCDFVTFFAVGAALPNPSERVNVYLPRSLIERVDRAAADFGMSRSSLIGLALTRTLDHPWPAPILATARPAKRGKRP